MNLNLKKFDILYIIGLVATTLFMIIEFIFGFVALNITFLLFFWTMKLLSGFGLWILSRFTEKFTKKHVQVLIIIQVIVPGIFVGYAIYSIISSLPPAIPPTGIHYWLDLLIFLYGIISLMLTLYIIPLIRE